MSKPGRRRTEQPELSGFDPLHRHDFERRKYVRVDCFFGHLLVHGRFAGVKPQMNTDEHRSRRGGHVRGPFLLQSVFICVHLWLLSSSSNEFSRRRTCLMTQAGGRRAFRTELVKLLPGCFRLPWPGLAPRLFRSHASDRAVDVEQPVGVQCATRFGNWVDCLARCHRVFSSKGVDYSTGRLNREPG